MLKVEKCAKRIMLRCNRSRARQRRIIAAQNSVRKSMFYTICMTKSRI